MNDDKINPGQDAATSKGSGPQTNPKVVVHHIGDSKPDNNPASDVRNEAQNQQEPILPVRLWRRFRRKPAPPRANWAEKSTVTITLVLACIGLLQACIYWQQKKIMESSGHQTDQIISAADTQACASVRNANAAESFSQTSQIQAQKMGDLAELAKQVAKSQLGAPEVIPNEWMGVYHTPKGELWADIRFQNDGTSEAISVQVAATIEFLPVRPKAYPTNFEDLRQSTIVRYDPEERKKTRFGIEVY